MTHTLLAGKNGSPDRFSAEGKIYPLLSEPTDREFGANPYKLAEAARNYWTSGHDGTKLPSVEICVEVLRLCYRHYPCPYRRYNHAGLNAVQWSMTELKRFLAYKITGRPDATTHRIRGHRPILLRAMKADDLAHEHEEEPCQSTTLNVEPVAPLSAMPSSSDTPIRAPVGVSVSPPTTGVDPAKQHLNLSRLVDRLMQPPKSGVPSKHNGHRHTGKR